MVKVFLLFLSMIAASLLFTVLSVVVFLTIEAVIWISLRVFQLFLWNPALTTAIFVNAVFVGLLRKDIYLWIESKLHRINIKRSNKKMVRLNAKKYQNR